MLELEFKEVYIEVRECGHELLIWVTDICHVKTCKGSKDTRGAQLPSSVYLERVNLQRYETD